jgi:CubicO group peptidase (beta-lactamase class C family)
MIIEREMNLTYEQALRKYIFEPVGMEHSGFDFIHLNSPDKATGYVVFDSSRYTSAVLMDSTVTYAAGSIYSTSGDLYRYQLLHLSSEQQYANSFCRYRRQSYFLHPEAVV